MPDFLHHHQQGAVVTLTMNEPATRNALTGNTAIPEVVAACERINADPSVRVVILTGTDPAFSAGGNVKTMRRYFEEEMDPATIRREYRDGIQRLALALYNLEVPVIAAVNGLAVGAGNDIACMCDIRIASEQASFAESFVKLGIIPGDGGAWFLPRTVGMSRAAEMAFTGDKVDADEALACGLVSRVVPHDQLMATARELADRIAVNPGEALRMTKRLLREGQTATLPALLEMSAGFQAVAHKSANHREAVMAFIEKRKPVFSDG